MIRPCCCHVLSPWLDVDFWSTGHASFTRQLQLFVVYFTLFSLVNIVLLWFDMICSIMFGMHL